MSIVLSFQALYGLFPTTPKMKNPSFLGMGAFGFVVGCLRLSSLDPKAPPACVPKGTCA